LIRAVISFWTLYERNRSQKASRRKGRPTTKSEFENPRNVNRATNPTRARRPMYVVPMRSTAHTSPTTRVVTGVN
jgi:hypothetical protein